MTIRGFNVSLIDQKNLITIVAKFIHVVLVRRNLQNYKRASKGCRSKMAKRMPLSVVTYGNISNCDVCSTMTVALTEF